jgi:hypothetical protein
MGLYIRPYFDAFLQKQDIFASQHTPLYPYAIACIRQHDIFDIYPLDGGAYFFTLQHLGSVSGERMIEAYEQGDLLAPWLEDHQVRWNKVWEESKHGQQRRIEQHVWLNRLYFLLPFAQQCLVGTDSQRWADLWIQYFKSWLKTQAPYQNPDDKSNYVWKDMQVTWRTLVLIHSIHMLGYAQQQALINITASDWHLIYQQLWEHSQMVYAEAAKSQDMLHIQAPHKYLGNHHLQKGMALLLSGILFAEWPGADKQIVLGRAIVKSMMTSEITADGGSIEASPSYSHFIARLYVDTYAVLRDNHHQTIPGLLESIQKQYHFLQCAASPQGLTLQISDSYPKDVRGDLALVSQILPEIEIAPEPQDATYVRVYNDTGLAIIHTGALTIYIDAMQHRGMSHIHAGRPHFLLFYDNQPVFIDSGACNYDNPLLKNWLKVAEAHNCVTVRRPGEEPSWSQHIMPQIKMVSTWIANDRVELTYTYCSDTKFEAQYVWTRRFVISPNQLELYDEVDAVEPVIGTFYLHLVPHCIVTLNAHATEVSGANWEATITVTEPESSDMQLSSAPVATLGAELVDAPMLFRSQTGQSIRFGYQIAITNR